MVLDVELLNYYAQSYSVFFVLAEDYNDMLISMVKELPVLSNGFK